MTNGYKDLVVWQRAMDVAVEAYRLTGNFPKEEMYGLSSQIRRAAVSIASNIAEGEGRKTNKEFYHFLGIALGSKSELETQIILSERVNLLKEPETVSIKKNLDNIGKMITALRRKLKKVGVES
ncbi:four helix bundle protein [uncultured Fibrobacter sp.]|jgi:four helix bundle protein|uniref:four helix bundle protein n=1 Tax=uncultured Fibrobacter sp. TaxID=261512 RepID=UPI0025D8E82B|nr:four helix bundle protein [uncultured Fibrobacter sp.]